MCLECIMQYAPKVVAQISVSVCTWPGEPHMLTSLHPKIGTTAENSFVAYLQVMDKIADRKDMMLDVLTTFQVKVKQ